MYVIHALQLGGFVRRVKIAKQRACKHI